jgi:hypothetical protein
VQVAHAFYQSLATQEAEIGGLQVQSHLWANSSEDPPPQKKKKPKNSKNQLKNNC